MASLALLACVCGILVLFYMNRCPEIRSSKALWLPTMWLLIVGSRPVSAWLGGYGGGGDQQTALLEGSPIDAAVFALLLAVGLVVLAARRRRALPVLKFCIPVLLYFAYCLLSVTWSAFPMIALKRWTKDLGD